MTPIPYTVQKDRRKWVHVSLAVLAVLTTVFVGSAVVDLIRNLVRPVAPFLNLLPLPLHMDPDELVSYSTALTIFTLYLWVFENLLWRLPPIRQFLGTPNLNGWWVGTRVRERDGAVVVTKFAAKIVQSWSRIQIKSYNANTTSHATSAAFMQGGATGTDLIFTYEMRPNGNAPQNLWGAGTQWLSVSDDAKELKGHYYSTNSRSGGETLQRVRRKPPVIPPP